MPNFAQDYRLFQEQQVTGEADTGALPVVRKAEVGRSLIAEPTIQAPSFTEDVSSFRDSEVSFGGVESAAAAKAVQTRRSRQQERSSSNEIVGQEELINKIQNEKNKEGKGSDEFSKAPDPFKSKPVAEIKQGTDQFFELIKKHFPKEEWERAYNVMIGESGGRANAKGDDYVINDVYAPSYGLFQIRALPGRPSGEQLSDPEFNVKYAADLWKSQGWSPWTVARNLGYVR